MLWLRLLMYMEQFRDDLFGWKRLVKVVLASSGFDPTRVQLSKWRKLGKVKTRHIGRFFPLFVLRPTKFGRCVGKAQVEEI